MKEIKLKIIDNVEREICTILIQQEFIMGKGFVLTINPDKGCFIPEKESLIYHDEFNIIRTYRKCDESIDVDRLIRLLKAEQRKQEAAEGNV